MPERIQRRRTKGWRMPENTVSVTRPGKYGNPFKAGETFDQPLTLALMGLKEPVLVRDNEHAVELFRKVMKVFSKQTFQELRGKNLACWCREGAICHADVLLELANK